MLATLNQKLKKIFNLHHYKSSFYIVHRMNQNGSMQICAIYFISRSLKSLLHALIKYFFLFSKGNFQWSPLCRVILFMASRLRSHFFKNAYRRNKVQGNDYEIWFTKNLGKKFFTHSKGQSTFLSSIEINRKNKTRSGF